MEQKLLEGLSEEQIARAKSCKTTEELLSLAKAEGVELSDEQLEAVSGGGCFSSRKCPKCGSKDYGKHIIEEKIGQRTILVCNKCGTKWTD